MEGAVPEARGLAVGELEGEAEEAEPGGASACAFGLVGRPVPSVAEGRRRLGTAVARWLGRGRGRGGRWRG
eukprot:CAMPEP_0113718646 /NCGR_PEP_ID=MMETSP0038_2-20120614/35328_1 /TAXON_ID=2898 /ORGANISM="Cryptomonas paramecium" /LENGTH=70 /DNA_ID=CAMNT_0000646837 /DNA_START=81 /DNA_END=290 /DNA_ORIENTATION=- /assembly_acc=CAM_ASM_000170